MPLRKLPDRALTAFFRENTGVLYIADKNEIDGKEQVNKRRINMLKTMKPSLGIYTAQAQIR